MKLPTEMITSALVVEATAGFGFCVSVTVTVNFNVVVGVSGAVNVGVDRRRVRSVTGVPAVWVHWYVSV